MYEHICVLILTIFMISKLEVCVVSKLVVGFISAFFGRRLGQT